MTKINKAEIRQILKNVIDPELGINIVDLGLVYDVQINQKQVLIKMTLTTPGCPLAPVFVKMIKQELASLDAFDEEHVEVEFVFDPPWHQGMISEAAKAQLGMD